MRARKRIISFMLAWLMIFSAAPQVFAATFDVGNDDQMASSWETASNNTDSENTFNMTNDINMEGHNLTAESGKTYVVNGNGHDIQNVEVHTQANSNVEINADVSSSTDTALSVTGSSAAQVTVNGDVTTTGSNDGQTALEVFGTNVTVNGDVEMNVVGSTNNVNREVVTASESAEVVINGDVVSAEEGISVTLGAEVAVTGDLETVGNTIVSIEETKVTVGGNVTGESCLIMGGQVEVGGDLTVTDEVTVSLGALIMNEDSTLEADTVKIYNNSGVLVGDIEADTVTVGISTLSREDKSQLECESITNDESNSTLETGKKATVEVAGNVDNIVARENSAVLVHGTANSAKNYDSARIVIKQSNSQPKPQAPEQPSNTPQEPAKPVDPIVELCQGYDSMNALYDHTQILYNIISWVNEDLCAEMNLASAFWASLFSYNDILVDRFLDNVDEDADIYNYAMYNADSVERLKNTEKVNPYYVSVYKDTLAEAISELTPVQVEVSETEKDIISAVFGIVGDVVDFDSTALKKKDLSYLEKLLTEGGSFTPEDAELFILMTKDSVINGEEARKLSDLVNASNEIAKNADCLSILAAAGMTAVDFVAHLLGEYESQISYLDHILQNNSLDPALFVAAVDLRYEYSEKLLGAIDKVAEKIVEFGAGWFLDKGVGMIAHGGLWGMLNLGVDIFGFVSGGGKDSKDLQTATAMPAIANVAINNYIDAIRNVQNGDTSEEAVQQVKTSFVVLRTTLINMCEIMTNIGDKQQEKNYRNMIESLKTVKIGFSVEV